MQYFNIQVASQLSGVASATIRAWEKRYNAVVPERAENKHRLYSEKDIEKLALLYKLTEFGQSIGKIAHLNLEELKDIYSTLLHKPYDERQIVTPNHDKIDYESILGNFYLALAAYKIDIISHELDKAISLLTPRELCLNVIVPLFQEIGLRVDRKELSIAQEHTISAIVSFHIGQMIGLHYQKNHIREDLILVSTPEGDAHTIGILSASLLLVHHGIKFIYMGPNLPAASLAEAANALNCKAILLGVSLNNEHVKKPLEVFLNELRQDLTVSADIWIGGNVKSQSRLELDKRRIPFFATLQDLDEFLERY